MSGSFSRGAATSRKVTRRAEQTRGRARRLRKRPGLPPRSRRTSGRGAAPRVESRELVVLPIAAREVDQAAADIADGHIGVATPLGVSDHSNDLVVGQYEIAVNAVDLFA